MRKVFFDDFKEAFASLTDREKILLPLRIGENGEKISQASLCDIFECSQSYISRIEKKALLKLSKAYMKEDME